MLQSQATEVQQRSDRVEEMVTETEPRTRCAAQQGCSNHNASSLPTSLKHFTPHAACSLCHARDGRDC